MKNAPTVVDIEERSWLPNYFRGDQKAFDKLLQNYQRPLYSYLARCGFDLATRDELFQEVCLNIHLGAGKYKASQPMRPWIYAIAANVVRNHVRKKEIQTVTLVEEENLSVDPSLLPEQRVSFDSTLDWLQHQLSELPMRQRQVLLLVCVENLRLQEVADALKLPLNTTKTHLSRARQTLTKARLAYEQTVPDQLGGQS